MQISNQASGHERSLTLLSFRLMSVSLVFLRFLKDVIYFHERLTIGYGRRQP
jgi:hypothetical protein